jgi:hypothetical protein
MTTFKTTTLAAAAALLSAAGLDAQSAPTPPASQKSTAAAVPAAAEEGVFDAPRAKPGAGAGADEAVFEDFGVWEPKVFASVGPSVALLMQNGSATKGAKDVFMYGGSLSLGFYPFKNDSQQHFFNRVSVEVGYFTGSPKSARYTPDGGDIDFVADAEVGSIYRFSRKTEQFHVPVMLSWEFEFPFGFDLEGQPHWRFRFGPSVGITYIDIKTTHTGSNWQDGEGLTDVSDQIAGAADRNSSGTKFLLNYGATIAFTYDAPKHVSRWLAPRGNFSFDIAYRFRGHDKLKVSQNDYGTSQSHQLTASIIWRF